MLRLGAYLNFLIAIAHLVGLFWAEEMFEITGIANGMAIAAETIRPLYPYFITVVVAIFFFKYGGWSLFADVMILQSLTLHTDCYYGYSFYNSSQDKLKDMGEPSSAFRSWKITSTLLHESGLFLSGRFHQFVNRTSIATEASRFSIGLGYRFRRYN